MLKYFEINNSMDPKEAKGKTIFFGVFAFVAFLMALLTFSLKVPTSSTFTPDALIFAKLLFFIVFMVLNAIFVVKTIQHHTKSKIV